MGKNLFCSNIKFLTDFFHHLKKNCFFCRGAQARGTQASVVVVHRLSCPAAGGIFLGQGLNPRALRRQVDSYLLYHSVSPENVKLLHCFLHCFSYTESLLFTEKSFPLSARTHALVSFNIKMAYIYTYI